MMTVLALYGAPLELLLQQPRWLALSVISLIVFAKMILGGLSLARAGRNPLWVLTLLVPVLDVVALWVFAFSRWPALPEKKDQ